MDIYALIQTRKHLQRGAGLVKYAPITLVGICLLVSLFQVIVQQNHAFLLVIGAIVVLVLCLIAYGFAKDYRSKKDTDNEL